jgi:hypothetical protein
MQRALTAGALLASLLLGAAPGNGKEAATLKDAITKGKPLLSLRYRYEDVSDDSFGDKHARASTLRTTIGYQTLSWKGLSILIEAEDVSPIGNDLYNNAGAGSLNNGVRDRPVVADPAITELNQVFLQWQGHDSRFQVGREEILVGDQRYVGNVGWRQNHQSFDAVTFTNSSLERVDFFYSYVDNVNRIDGSNHEMGSHLFNAAIGLGKVGKLTLYGYWLDYDQPAQVGLSSSTYGAEFAGKHALSDATSLLYELEYADQSDYQANPNQIDAAYYFLMFGAAFKPLTVKLGYEVLEGSPEDGSFQTPLATLHKFNGWADKFLSTPINGLEDLFLQLAGKHGPLSWAAFYHDFSADTGGASYGDEPDLSLVYTAPWKQSFGFKAAFYDAQDFAADTEKWWLWTSFKI